MITKDIYLDLINRAGAYNALTWRKAEKPAAAHRGHDLLKITRATVRAGVEYQRLAENLARECGPLPWGYWVDYPHIVGNTKNGVETLYARIYTLDGGVRSTYFVDGEEVLRADYMALLPPSRRNPGRPVGGVLTVTLENILQINGTVLAAA